MRSLTGNQYELRVEGVESTKGPHEAFKIWLIVANTNAAGPLVVMLRKILATASSTAAMVRLL